MCKKHALEFTFEKDTILKMPREMYVNLERIDIDLINKIKYH